MSSQSVPDSYSVFRTDNKQSGNLEEYFIKNYADPEMEAIEENRREDAFY